VQLKNIDIRIFKEKWRQLCRNGLSTGEDFRTVYSSFTTFLDSRLRFRGGDPSAIRNSLEIIAKSINPGAVAVVESEKPLS